MMVNVAMTVNGQPVTAEIDSRTLLAAFLREHLSLTGTHIACDTSQCGACVVHLDGHAVKSCAVLAVQADGGTVETIESLSAPDQPLHPMQEAFREHHALQCGFCTPGMVMAAIELAKRNPDPSVEDVRQALEGNICRCTGYDPIVTAVQAGARAMHGRVG